MNFVLTVTEPGFTALTYSFTVTVAEATPDPDTANVTFALTTPAEDGSTNHLEGGGATRTVTVNVANATESVVITGTKTDAQTVAVGGTGSSDVTPGGTGTAPTYTVDTSDVATAGGSVEFTLTVQEADHTSIVYNFTVTVAGT